MTITALMMGILLIDTVGVILVFTALLTHKLDSFKMKYRVAIALVGIGFLWQIVALFQVMIIDQSMLSKQLSFWMLKDTGIVLWFIYIFYDLQIKNLCFKIGHGHSDGKAS